MNQSKLRRISAIELSLAYVIERPQTHLFVPNGTFTRSHVSVKDRIPGNQAFKALAIPQASWCQ